MRWKDSKSSDGCVVLSGAFDEHAETAFAELETHLGTRPAFRLDLAEAGPINSLGLSIWVKAYQRLSAKAPVELHRCAIAVMRYATMVGAGARFGDAIRSVMVPFRCTSCKHAFESLMTRDAILAIAADDAPEAPCPKCGTGRGDSGNAADDLETYATAQRKQRR